MPITIDGSSVSALTIDGTTVQEVTMDGDVVYSASDPLEVSATLNSGSATLWVYEDTNQDGTADNVEEITLSNGTTTDQLSSFSLGSGNDYWWYVSAEPSSETSRVRIHSVTINT